MYNCRALHTAHRQRLQARSDSIYGQAKLDTRVGRILRYAPKKGANMRTILGALLLSLGLLIDEAAAQALPPAANPAMNNPDQQAWELFVQVTARAGGAGNNALFETWASDTDTFTTNPTFPTAPAPLALHPPIVPSQGWVTLSGSRRFKPAEKLIRPVDPKEKLVISLYLKNPKQKARVPGSSTDLSLLAQSTTRRQLARQRAIEFAPAVSVLKKFARKHGLSVRRLQFARRCVVLSGNVDQMTKAFGAVVHIYGGDGQRVFRARSGSLKLPSTIARWVRAVHGFDHRPQVMLRSQASDANGTGLWPSDIAKLYGIPIDSPGAPQCVGIIALGGGYLASDLEQAAKEAGRAAPSVAERFVDNGKNEFGGGTVYDEEIALDMQVIAGIVPDVRIVVYFAQNNVASLAAAIHEAVFDDVNRPTVLSISWGSAEKYWQPGPRETMQAALQDAVRLKISVTAASGDYLATAGLDDGAAHVFFPSSSPYVLGCGGTEVDVQNNAIWSERVWNNTTVGTGGGISEVFAVPAYQANAALPQSVTTGKSGRGVPDVAAAAGQLPGYRIIVGGNPIVMDGTSAATPLWAAILALANARRAVPIGLANPVLYTTSGLFRPITEGDNRVAAVGYAAAPGLIWNACTGLGVPKGADLVQTLATVRPQSMRG